MLGWDFTKKIILSHEKFWDFQKKFHPLEHFPDALFSIFEILLSGKLGSNYFHMTIVNISEYLMKTSPSCRLS